MRNSQINEWSRPFRILHKPWNEAFLDAEIEADQRKFIQLSCAVLSHWFLPARNENRFSENRRKWFSIKCAFETGNQRNRWDRSNTMLKNGKGWRAIVKRKWRAKRAENLCMKNAVCMKKSTSFLRRTHPVRTQDKLSNLNPLRTKNTYCANL